MRDLQPFPARKQMRHHDIVRQRMSAPRRLPAAQLLRLPRRLPRRQPIGFVLAVALAVGEPAGPRVRRAGREVRYFVRSVAVGQVWM